VSRKQTEVDPRVAFGRVIREFRLAQGLSQERLADLAGIHRNYAGEVERGTRNVALLNMVRIARALKVPLASLINEMEQKNWPPSV
jgi:transcriptional regulator with XRE-family HTH domain